MSKIGEIKCNCCGVGVHEIKEGKGGILSGTCSNAACRSQLMIKSPSSVMALRQRLDPAAAAPAAAAHQVQQKKTADDFLSQL